MFKAAVATLIFLVVPLASASAADMAQQPPMMPAQVMPIVMPAPIEAPSSWYLRGDIGVGNLQTTNVDYLPNPLNNPSDFTIQSVALQDQVFYLLGVGYEFNNWLRFDATAEYRNKDSFVFWGGYTTACPNPYAQCLDVYNGYISSWVFLANAYVDLFTWCGLHPVRRCWRRYRRQHASRILRCRDTDRRRGRWSQRYRLEFGLGHSRRFQLYN